VGFEAMPQIADLEIAATWDEIELEAALRGVAEAPHESSAKTASALADALRAVEELKRLPKEERKRRAEVLLRALTSVPAEASLEPETKIDLAAAAPKPAPAVADLHEASVDVSPGAEIMSPDVAPIVPERAEPVAAASTPAVETAPEAAPALELAPEAVTAPVATPEPDAIPKFLTTGCAALEPEQPDSLIPLRTAAAASALIGAVLLIYFGSSQEFGVAARPIVAASEIASTHGAAPKASTSLAARQAFVALPPEFAASPEAVRPHRPSLVGFDLFDEAAPPAAIAVKADASTAAPAPPAPLVVPPPTAAVTAALPPSPGSDVAALIKRGDDLLKAGDIAAARAAYERAAAQGSAKAQIGVGKTYDPLVLAKLGARGVRGDPVQAAAWYARAGEAGDEEGQQRLHALISGLSDCLLSQGTCASRKP